MDSERSAVRRLRVAGVRAAGSGYPNAEQTIRLLCEHRVAGITDLGYLMPDGVHLWQLNKKGALSRLVLLARIGLLNGMSVVRVLFAHKDRNLPVYVPYPSIFFLWMLSWLPRSVRPPCIADAYISIWDAMYRDRGGRADVSAGRVLRGIEARALRTAAVVIVDTEANRLEMTSEFGLEPSRVRAWPLAIDEDRFTGLPLKSVRRDGGIRVLFLGTLIPLHGVSVLLGAIRLLARDSRFEFRIVGDGQLSPLVEEFILQHPLVPLRWEREWQSLDQLSQEIAKADICLGVFGGDAKASRVLPFKLYMYLAAGKAIVTQAKLSTPSGASRPPVESVNGDESAIAAGILRLVDSLALRRKRQKDSRNYYLHWLSNSSLIGRWRSLFSEFGW